MKFSNWLSLAFALISSSAALAAGESDMLSLRNRQEAKALFKAYNGLTQGPAELPLSKWGSYCTAAACAFNFETDREDFGILTQFNEMGNLRGRTVAGFRVDPNGVSLDEEDPFVPGVDLTSAALASKLDDKNLEVLAAKIQKNMGKVLNLRGSFAKGESECRHQSEGLWCAINFKDGDKVKGVALEGRMGESGELYFIDALEASDKAVRLP